MKRLISVCAVMVMTSMVYALPSDNFDDNLRNASLWNLLESNPSSVWCSETNQRLEIQSVGYASEDVAAYVPNHWGFVTTNNFSFKVDFHNSITSGATETYASAGLTLGKGNDFEVVQDNHVSVSAAWDFWGTPAFCFDYSYVINGIGPVPEYYLARSSNDGTLYISYDTSVDELYLSSTGYGKANAAYTMSDLLRGQWDGYIVTPIIHGSAKGIILNSGAAYLDNFVVTSGTIVQVCEYKLAGDLNDDCKVDFSDFAIMADNWLIDCQANPSNPACVPK